MTVAPRGESGQSQRVNCDHQLCVDSWNQTLCGLLLVVDRLGSCPKPGCSMSRSRSPWSGFADAVSFGLACQQVVALRLTRIAFGGTRAHREMARMVAEKATAAAHAQIAGVIGLATGGPGKAAAAAGQVYRRAVNKNKRRLRRPG
jgi:hypothetical protein